MRTEVQRAQPHEHLLSQSWHGDRGKGIGPPPPPSRIRIVAFFEVENNYAVYSIGGITHAEHPLSGTNVRCIISVLLSNDTKY